MQKITIGLLIFTTILFSSCGTETKNTDAKTRDTSEKVKKDSRDFLNQYWQLEDADNPTSRDISFTNDDGILFESGMVFINDSSLLENPAGEMVYGKFKRQGNAINAVFDNGRKAIYTIEHLSNEQLRMKRVENKHTSELTYKPTNTEWPDANKNPFSKKNYAWCKKPKKPETTAEIRDRVKGYVQFCEYYFNGFVNGHATKIDFIGLPNCLDWYQGGITIQNEDKLDKKWENCFYSPEQAYQGRQILEDAIVKKYNWDTNETNWLKQTADVLNQIYNNL